MALTRPTTPETKKRWWLAEVVCLIPLTVALSGQAGWPVVAGCCVLAGCTVTLLLGKEEEEP